VNVLKTAAGQLRDLWLVFMVAIAVVVASTLVGSVVSHLHQADAESVSSSSVAAVPASGGNQILGIKGWGVQLTFPLNSALPLLSYATTASNSVGLSASDLMKLGADCQPSQNALGTLIRMPAGTFAKTPRSSTMQLFVSTVGSYDYVYQMAQGDCSDTPAGSALVNQETAMLRPELGTLSQLQK
jgi:hypothetical protein